MNNNNNINWLTKALYKSIANHWSDDCEGACCFKTYGGDTDGPVGPIGTPINVCKMKTKSECREKGGDWYGATAKCNNMQGADPNRCNVIFNDAWKKCKWTDSDGKERCSAVAGFDFQQECKCDARGGQLDLCEPGTVWGRGCCGITTG